MPRCLLRRVSGVFVLMALSFSANSQGVAHEPDSWIDAQLDNLVELYEHLHRNPELSYREFETAKRMAEEFAAAGAEVTTGIGKLGVVGVMRNGEGPTVLLRADMDALPVTEDTGLPYASTVTTEDAEGNPVGVMHACGHDLHMTNLIGSARWLNAHRDQWSGTVVLIAQPAEEAIGGAEEMLDDGLYERFPKPDFALALHVTPEQPTGTVGYTSGPALAGATTVEIRVRGRGGHGAAPHRAIDPIVLASALVLDLQTIVTREIDPTDSAVLTVGSIHGGTRANIIPAEVRLQLTLRAFRDEVRDQLIAGIRRKANALAQAHRAPEPTVTVHESTPPTVNTPELVDRLVPVFQHALGEENVIENPPVMGAEDFGLYGRDGVPIFMFRLGTIDPQRLSAYCEQDESPPPLHSPWYYPDPAPSLQTGIRAMTSAVIELLPPQE